MNLGTSVFLGHMEDPGVMNARICGSKIRR